MTKLEGLVRGLGGELIKVGKPVKTVGQAVEATRSKPSRIIKSLLFVSEKGPVLVIVDGESRADLGKLSKLFGRVRLASPEEVREITGYEVGGVPPVGVEVRTIVDPKVIDNEFVIGGGGRIDTLLKLDPKKIVKHQKAEVLNIRMNDSS